MLPIAVAPVSEKNACQPLCWWLGLFALTTAVPLAKNLVGDRRSDAQGHRLDDDLSQRAVERLSGADAVEHQQHRGRGNDSDCDDFDRLRYARNKRVLLAFEPGDVRESDIGDEGEAEERHELPAVAIDPDPPDFHREEERHAEQVRAGERPHEVGQLPCPGSLLVNRQICSPRRATRPGVRFSAIRPFSSLQRGKQSPYQPRPRTRPTRQRVQSGTDL